MSITNLLYLTSNNNKKTFSGINWNKSSDTLKIKRLKSQLIKEKNWTPKQDNKNHLRSNEPDGRELTFYQNYIFGNSTFQ